MIKILTNEQEDAVKWMVAREAGPTPGGGILADDVGKGKTYMAAGLIKASQLWPTLVIVPKSTIWEWAGVLKRVTNTVVCVVTSMCDDQLREVSRSKLVLATISCMSVRTVPVVIADRIWGRVILDEAHAIRNPATLGHKALRALRAHATWAMTATPVQNKPSDLLALARFVGFETDDAEAVRRELMMRRINDTLTSRLDVETVRVELELPGEKELYDSLHRTFETAAKAGGGLQRLLTTDECDDGGGGTAKRGNAFERLLRCRQAATHPGIYHRAMAFRMDKGYENHAELAADWSMKPSSKLEWLYRDLEKCKSTRERSLVFCDWIDEMDMIHDFLEARGISVERFDGSLTVCERESILSSFKSHDGPQVLLLQVKCGACGLNLQVASRVYMMRPQWNPAIEYQAIGRANRTGQTSPVVTVRRLVAVGTVDEAMDVRLRGKLRSITDIMCDDVVERCLAPVKDDADKSLDM